MDPTFLLSEELEHELNLRGVYNLSTRRLKTATLRGLLESEFEGTEQAPKNSDGLACAEAEEYTCSQIIENLRLIVSEALTASEIRGTEDAFHRVLHVTSRLERICPAVGKEKGVASMYAEASDWKDVLSAKREELIGRVAPSRANITSSPRGSTGQNSSGLQKSFLNIPILAPLNGTSTREDVRRSSLNPSAGAFQPRSGLSDIDLFGAWGGVADPDQIEEQRLSDLVRNDEGRASRYPNPASFREAESNAGAIRNPFSKPTPGAAFMPRPLSAKEPSTRKELGATRKSPALIDLVGRQSLAGRSSAPVASSALGSFPNRNFMVDPRSVNKGKQGLSGNLNQARSEPTYFPSKHYKPRDEPAPARDYLSYFDQIQRGVSKPVNNAAPKLRGDVDLDPDSEEDYMEDRRWYERNREENRRGLNRVKRGIPVHQWRIEFSGDGRGSHLYDFLLQLSLHQRSEHVTNREMLESVIHLLSGRARLWFQANCDEFENMETFVAAIKDEFLPRNYDYVLLNDISNRTQKYNESFGEFITHMQALFKCLSVPLEEDHKLYMIQKNLSPRYALSIAPLDIRTVNQLAEICRRIDMRCSKQTIPLPFQPVQHGFQRQVQRRFGDRQVYAIDGEWEDQEGDAEVNAIRRIMDQQQLGQARGDQVRDERRVEAPRGQQPMGRRPEECWNCRRQGHVFDHCPQPRNGVFCFKCGLSDTTSRECRRCLGNGGGNPQRWQEPDPRRPPRQ